MYSYECNILCDHCPSTSTKAILSGEPMETPEAAKESAIKEAEANGWTFADNQWSCSECNEWCTHHYADGRSAVKGAMTAMGFVGHCAVCGEVIEP